MEKGEVVSMLDFAVPDFNDINLNTVRTHEADRVRSRYSVRDINGDAKLPSLF